MGESSKHRQRMQREGYRETRPGYYSKAVKPSTEHASVQSIMDKHYADSNIGTVDAQISQMEGDTPGGSK